jgi:hypothetical protein
LLLPVPSTRHTVVAGQPASLVHVRSAHPFVVQRMPLMQSVSVVQSSTHAANIPQLKSDEEQALLPVHPQIPPGAPARQSPLGQCEFR